MKKTTENQPIFLGGRTLTRAERLQRIAVTALGAAAVVLAVCVVLRYARAGQARPLILQKAEFSDALYDPARLDLNEAAPEELAELPGIGPVLAGRIAARREELGSFETKEDVLSVYGIGEAIYERIEPYITY